MARRSLTTLAVVFGLSVCPRAASAHHGGDGAIAAAAIVLLLADASFITYDTVVAAKNERPATGAAIVESVVATPQLLLYTLLVGELGEGTETGVIASFATVPSFLTVHGIWGATTKNADPGTLYGVSWAMGADLAFTLPAVRNATRGALLDRTSGILEIVAAAPQIAVATPAALRQNGPERTAWYALDGWAGLLFVHGAASAIVGGNDTPPPLPSPAPPPPEPPPPEPTPSGPLEIETPDKDPPPKPTGAFLVPGTLRLRPMAVQGGAGISIGAILW